MQHQILQQVHRQLQTVKFGVNDTYSTLKLLCEANKIDIVPNGTIGDSDQVTINDNSNKAMEPKDGNYNLTAGTSIIVTKKQ